jgi:tRNA-splicing ligase RtcB
LETKARRQLGTLGGGNHFIELCLDEEQRLWMMLHSGSRHVGKELAEAHIHRAKRLPHNLGLPDRNLAVFLAGSPEFETYWHDLRWAQAYARANRALMLELLKGVMARHFPSVLFDDPVTCHHNYVAREQHFGEHVFVTRKGAIRASSGEMGIIPGSMGTRSYIVRGLGQKDAFESASHGAGRRMSRAKAKKVFTPADVLTQTRNVECRKDPGIIDELPGAYKDIDHVMAWQCDLVETVHTLKQVMCIKG